MKLYFNITKDSIAPSRSENPNSAGVVAQLLTLMDGMDKRLDIIVIGATNRPNSIDPALRRPGRFEREIRIEPPSEKYRAEILKITMQKCPCDDIDYDSIARATNGYVGADLVSLCRESNSMALMRNLEGGHPLVQTRDFEVSIQKLGMPSLLRNNSVAVTATSWADIGGLDEVKKKLQRLVEWPLLHADVFDRMGLRSPKGILLYGPPGCSKTTLVKVYLSQVGDGISH
jgi:transitional endoplasmic reticulum ATPase